MADLFTLRDPQRVAAERTALQRFAARRDEFIDTIDLNALDDETWHKINDEDARLAETMMFAELYAQHLDQMIALGHSLSIPARKAA